MSTIVSIDTQIDNTLVSSSDAPIIGHRPYRHKNQIIGIGLNLADILDAFITV